MSADKDREPIAAVLSQASAPAGAVFLSYASEDAPAAQRIADAFQATGVEVWFDREELRGGDAWDDKIRQQIHDCRLFVPIISAHTEARLEGYFRREWKLACDRTEDMAGEVVFLVPVVIDGTLNASARVPPRFRHVQWTRLPGGKVTPAFVERVRRLLVPNASSVRFAAASIPAGSTTSGPGPSWAKPALWLLGVVLAAALAYLIAEKIWFSRRPSTPQSAPVRTEAASSTGAAPAGVAAFNPPPHSIAVLPFVNMSGDKEQEYFSDGLTEELLNSLARVKELQVAARTSAFSFKGKDTDIGTVAHKLNVGAVLEGSVRRSGHTIRVTTQLINAVTGFHLWSETYDRDLGDVLKLQTEIATAVASALKITLLSDEAAKIELGGTRNPAALDAYLRATKIYWSGYSPKVIETAVAGYTEAIRLDPDYALAYAARALAFAGNAVLWDTTKAAIRTDLDKAQADAAKAIALAPDLSEGYLARAQTYQELLEFKEAGEDYERALALAPGNARVLRNYGDFAIDMGHSVSGLNAIRRAVELDPLNATSQVTLGSALQAVRRYPEAITAYKDAEVLFSTGSRHISAAVGTAYYLLGDFATARATCEQNRDDTDNQFCLALAYDKLGRRADAEAELKKYQAPGDAGTYDYARINAQWGNLPKALEWLDTAVHARDPALILLRTDPLLDPLRQKPRFQAIERELKFPD
jgi:TolB-like protein/Flp pilus assembly protein TadD